MWYNKNIIDIQIDKNKIHKFLVLFNLLNGCKNYEKIEILK